MKVFSQSCNVIFDKQLSQCNQSNDRKPQKANTIENEPKLHKSNTKGLHKEFTNLDILFMYIVQ